MFLEISKGCDNGELGATITPDNSPYIDTANLKNARVGLKRNDVSGRQPSLSHALKLDQEVGQDFNRIHLQR